VTLSRAESQGGTMSRIRSSLSVLFSRLWARGAANVPQWPDEDAKRAGRDYAQWCYFRGYEKGREDARNGVRRPFT
jgi:hypothetical protein